jgi:hypothetical protein
MSIDEHAMATLVGRDGESVLGSVAGCKGCATTGFRRATHGDGDGITNSGVDRLAAEPIDRNLSYLIPIVMNLR